MKKKTKAEKEPTGQQIVDALTAAVAKLGKLENELALVHAFLDGAGVPSGRPLLHRLHFYRATLLHTVVRPKEADAMWEKVSEKLPGPSLPRTFSDGPPFLRPESPRFFEITDKLNKEFNAGRTVFWIRAVDESDASDRYCEVAPAMDGVIEAEINDSLRELTEAEAQQFDARTTPIATTYRDSSGETRHTMALGVAALNDGNPP